MRLMMKDGSNNDVILTDYKSRVFEYKKSAKDLNRKKVPMNKVSSVYFYMPAVYSEALNLYQGRKYAEAKAKFAECQKTYASMAALPDNYSTLAGFYSLECSRRQFDLDTLSSEQKVFLKEGLTRETHLQQLEVNAFWESVREKNWNQLDQLAKEWLKRKVPGSQRAQIAYCHGLALEELGKKDPKRTTEALNAYNRALTADSTASSEIVIAAANQALGIYLVDSKVKQAIKDWGTDNEKKSGSGYKNLLEANALAQFYTKGGFDAIKPLSAESKALLKYEAPKKEEAPQKEEAPKEK